MTTRQYAVNIADLSTDHLITSLLIARHIEHPEIVNAEPGRFDGAAAVLECDDETAENIMATIRLRYPKHAFRFYQGSSRTWARI